MISSPPEQAEHVRFRGKTLTPESPKPLHYPSPSNIPILENQMDHPMLNEPALNVGTPASFQSYPPQTQTPSAHSTTSYYAEQQSAPNYQNVAAAPSTGAAPTGYSQSAAYGSAMGAQTQDTTSIQNFSTQSASASSFSDANSAPNQDNRSAYPYAHTANAYAPRQSPAQSAHGEQSQSQANAGGSVNVQALLDQLSPTATNGASDRYAATQLPSQSAQSQGNTPSSSLPAAPNLPPRPPAQDKLATHPNYNPNDDIRSYHPHSAHRGSTQLQSLNLRAGAGDQAPMRMNQSPTTHGYGQRQSIDQQRSATPDDEDQRWPPEVNKLYEDFLDQERKFVTEGQWDQFPMGSRLFIGNLPTEKVTKRDIFHRFYRHGQLAQISIKQAYGFVQFLDAESCHRALQAEQGSAVRGRKMHLEVSKPQRNTKKADNDRNTGSRRRSRSPDYTRGGTGPRGRNEGYGGNQSAVSPRDRGDRRFRDRDDYRPIRSPSPRGGRGGYRGRDRSRDRYDTRRRSRSRSPRRYRSPSPRRSPSDDLPLPHRAPHQVPDVQVLVVNLNLPQDFIDWVADTLKRTNLRVDVLRMSARLNEAAVIRRQILEGVLAIVRLDNAALAKGKINIQIFDRRGGAQVTFNEYADLDPATAGALVVNAKQTSYQPVQPPAPAPYVQNYGAQPPVMSYQPQPQPQPPTPTNASNLSSLISSLDPNGLSQLLGAMSGNNTAAQTPQPPPAGLTPDLARLLGSISTPAQATVYTAPAQAPQQFSNPYQNPALPALFGGQTPTQPAAPPVQTPTQAAPPSGQPDMNEIMAQLAKYQR